MTALPGPVTKVNFDDSSVDDPKLAFNELAANMDKLVELHSFLAGLFGSTGEKPASRAEFGLKALATLDQVGMAQILDDAITRAKLANGTPGALWSFAETTGEIVELLPGEQGQSIVSNGPGKLPSWGNSRIVAHKHYQKSSHTTYSNAVSYNDNAPSFGDFQQYWAFAWTAQSTDHKLKVTVELPVVAGSSNQKLLVALFRGSTIVNIAVAAPDAGDRFHFDFWDTPPDTASKTYSIMVAVTGGNVTIGGTSPTRLFGGYAMSHLEIQELKLDN